MASYPLIVAFKSKMSELGKKSEPNFQAPANYKDPEKIARFVEDAADRFREEAVTLPYFGELSEVRVYDARTDKHEHFSLEKTERSVALQLYDWFVEDSKLSQFFSTNPFESSLLRPPPVYFAGFDIRKFLKNWGLACALAGRPIPVGVWYGNSDHREVAEMLAPTGMSIDFYTALQFLAASDQVEDKIKKIAKAFVPHENLKTEIALAGEIMLRLGFFGAERPEEE